MLLERLRRWPWLTLQIIVANVAIILALASIWYLAFLQQSTVYSDRLMATFNIEPGALHTMYVDDVERQLWVSVIVGLTLAIIASVGLAFFIGRPLRSLAHATEQLRHGDYRVRSNINAGEVGRLAEHFNALASTLEQEERRRAQFMTDLGHELRTPIMSIRGYTEGLEDRIFEPDEKYFKLMAGELSHLTALTHTIEKMRLDAHSEREVSDLACISVESLLKDSEHLWRTRFTQNNLQLVIEVDKAIKHRQFLATARALKQIVDNLFSNMLRYASTELPCQVTASKTEGNNMVELSFCNDAPGVSDDKLPFLFDRFFRLSQSRTRTAEDHSSGLGLAVVKQLCLSNNGHVTASLAGSCLVVSVLLPIE